MSLRCVLILMLCVAWLPVSTWMFAETPTIDLEAEEKAIETLRGVPSNLQKNRDGSVRFLRFSKSNVTNEHVLQIGAFSKLDYLAVVTPSVGGVCTNIST